MRLLTRLTGALATAAACFAAASPAAHAVNANDTPATAATLTNGVAFTGATTGARALTGDPLFTVASATSSCPRLSATVWFKVTGNGHSLTFSTAGSEFDTEIAVYASDASPGRPNDGDRIGCNNDAGPAGESSSQVTITNTTRGNTYLVQVGTPVDPVCDSAPDLCGTATGALKLLLTAAPTPANDARASALALATGAPSTADNTGATAQPGELLTCAGTPYAATVWFSWTAPAAGNATFDAAAAFTGASRPADTVVAVYRATDPATALVCNDDASAGNDGASRAALPTAVAAGDRFLFQVGARGLDAPGLGEGIITAQVTLTASGLGAGGGPDGDGDGFPPAQDCDDTNPQIHVGAFDVPDNGINEDCSPDGDAVNLDRDADGIPRPADCNDANAAIRPGTADVPGNGVDEDCSGADAPFPLLDVGVVGFSATGARGTRFSELSVKRAPAGATVTLRCSGRGCPFKTKTVRVKRAGTLPLTRLLKGRSLRAGATLEVRVTSSATRGRVARWSVRSRKAPRRADLCLAPGTTKPGAC